MKIFLTGFSLVLLWNLSSARPSPSQDSLKLVHVLFRHGNRNPEEASLWESNPYYNESYYPEGYGQLTNAGKRTEFNLGRSLRNRFDKFLGDTWNINYLDVRTTNYNRTKMSAELVLAGLYPPRRDNIWNIWLPWQPIPFNYFPTSSDPELYPFGCSTFGTKLEAVLSQTDISTYLSERYAETLQILNDTIGVSSLMSGVGVYDSLLVQQQLGYELEEWTKQVFPEPLHSLTVDYYYLMANTTDIRQLLAGSLVKKIVQDTSSFIDGTLSPSTRKMFVYSAHDTNVGPMVLSLDIWKLVTPPPYGSHVIFEVHEIDGVYGFKLFYGESTDTNTKPHGPLTLPGCAEFCPFDEFAALVEEILPSSDALCYGS